MPFSDHDRTVLRHLAARKAEIAALPIQKENRKLWMRLNRLQPVKPLIWVNEVCWQEMDVGGEWALQARDAFCRGLETELRRELYQWDHFRGDMVVEDVMYCWPDRQIGNEHPVHNIDVDPIDIATFLQQLDLLTQASKVG